jgi:hypothetical protein
MSYISVNDTKWSLRIGIHGDIGFQGLFGNVRSSCLVDASRATYYNSYHLSSPGSEFFGRQASARRPLRTIMKKTHCIWLYLVLDSQMYVEARTGAIVFRNRTFWLEEYIHTYQTNVIVQCLANVIHSRDSFWAAEGAGAGRPWLLSTKYAKMLRMTQKCTIMMYDAFQFQVCSDNVCNKLTWAKPRSGIIKRVPSCDSRKS